MNKRGGLLGYLFWIAVGMAIGVFLAIKFRLGC